MTIIAFVAFIIMIVLALIAWSPQNNPAPGPHRESSDAEDMNDWNKMQEKYIKVNEKTSFDQAIVNYIDVTERLNIINKLKTRLVRWAAGALIVQVVCLVCVALLAS